MKWLMPMVLVLLIISINCNSKKDQPLSTIRLTDTVLPIQFVKEKEVKIDFIGNAGLIYLYSDNYIFLEGSERDNADRFFLKYDLELQFISENKIPYGEGPMECFSPSVMGGTEDNIIVDDIPTMRYYLYGTDFKSRQNISCKRRGWIPHGAKYSVKYKTLASSYQKFDEKEYKTDEFIIYLRKLTDDLSLEDLEVYRFQWPGTYPPDLMDIGKPFHFAIIADCLYVLRKDEYRIIKFDLTGKRLKDVQANGLPDISFSKSQRCKWIDDQNIKEIKSDRFIYPKKLWHANWILELAGGIAVGRINDYSSDEKEWGEADYFDLDLNYLGKIKMPWFRRYNIPSTNATDYYIYSKGDFLFMIDIRETEDDEEYWLSRWRIKK